MEFQLSQAYLICNVCLLLYTSLICARLRFCISQWPDDHRPGKISFRSDDVVGLIQIIFWVNVSPGSAETLVRRDGISSTTR